MQLTIQAYMTRQTDTTKQAYRLDKLTKEFIFWYFLLDFAAF